MGGGVVDTFLGSFSIHDASGSVNLPVIMNSDFFIASKEMRCICFSRRLFTSSIKRRIQQFFHVEVVLERQ